MLNLNAMLKCLTFQLFPGLTEKQEKSWKFGHLSSLEICKGRISLAMVTCDTYP